MNDDDTRMDGAFWAVLLWLACVVMAAALLAGCAPCDFEVRQGCVRVNAPVHFTPDMAEEALRLADESWGKTISLKHYEIDVVDDDLVDCAGKRDNALGCTCSQWPCSWMHLARLDPCRMAQVFYHELGHVAEPRAGHEDDRFSVTAEVLTICQRVP